MFSINLDFLKIVVVIALVVLILANLEFYINKRKAITNTRLKKRYQVIPPLISGFKHDVIIYNPGEIRKKDVLKETDAKNNIIKKSVDEHLASKLTTPLKNLKSNLKGISHSPTPLNDIYSSFGKVGEVVGVNDPLSYNGGSGYKMLLHPEDREAYAFIAYNQLYLFKKSAVDE